MIWFDMVLKYRKECEYLLQSFKTYVYEFLSIYLNDKDEKICVGTLHDIWN